MKFPQFSAIREERESLIHAKISGFTVSKLYTLYRAAVCDVKQVYFQVAKLQAVCMAMAMAI